MEEITDGVNNIAIAGDNHKKNRIQVSNTKKPLFFYVNLAKRYMQQHTEVELSALGMAISTVVSVAEILKNNGFAVEKKIITSTVEIRDESRARPISKAKPPQLRKLRADLFFKRQDDKWRLLITKISVTNQQL